MVPDAAHARLVHSVLHGASCSLVAPEHVRRSWQRCLDEYGLDPGSTTQPVVISHQELTARREQSSELLYQAEPELASLHRQLAGSGHSILLTDGDGVLLSYSGDRRFKGPAARTGLVPGGLWSERHGGTNGMGTCLAERAPLIVHRDQHFLSRNIRLTCCAAPIFDPRGELAAVLDASAESDYAQQHTLVLVTMSAQAIERRLFLHRFRDAFVVRFHSRPELLGTWNEGLIALDSGGAIVAFDRKALSQLGAKTAEEARSGPLERLFDLPLDALVRQSRRRGLHALPVYDARHGARYFALAQEPECAPSSPSADSASDSAAPGWAGPLDELDLGDPVMARSIRAAKRVAAEAVPVLLIGEVGTGKERFARAIHAASGRGANPFIAIGCPGLSSAQLEASVLEACSGTLFLDEIAELPAVAQARLLQLMQDGGARPTADVRLIAANSCSLEEKLRRGEFREDLYYRLQGLLLTLPRFQERTDKAALVLRLFAREAAAMPAVSLSERLVEVLCAQRWPGNLRQLSNVLRTMLAARSGNALDLADLPRDYGLDARPAVGEGLTTQREPLNALAMAEREALLRELDREHGNISHVARNLRISRNAVYRKMQRLRIPPPARNA